jgi:hypothetical protein
MYTRVTSLLNLYIRNIIPDDMSIPLLEHLAVSGRGEAVLRADTRTSLSGYSRKFVLDLLLRNVCRNA